MSILSNNLINKGMGFMDRWLAVRKKRMDVVIYDSSLPTINEELLFGLRLQHQVESLMSAVDKVKNRSARRGIGSVITGNTSLLGIFEGLYFVHDCPRMEVYGQ